jgi:2-oxoglutarate ferredoxin oxidoreductase subunit beta
LMAACGASYIARWTALQLRDLENSLTEAMTRRGFRFIEAITPCPTVYGRMNKRPRGLDEMLYYQQKSVVRNGADPKDVGITLDSPIVVGKFVDIQSPTYQESRDDILGKARAKGRL